MSRYAEVEQLIANLDNGLWGKDWDKALAEAIIRDAPSIDIVHCRECTYRDNRKKCPMRVFTGDNGFCCCGADDERSR